VTATSIKRWAVKWTPGNGFSRDILGCSYSIYPEKSRSHTWLITDITPVIIKITVLWGVNSCSLVGKEQGRTPDLHKLRPKRHSMNAATRKYHEESKIKVKLSL
jgi:hypothetical protein